MMNTESVISNVLHHLIDFDPELLRRVQSALYVVLEEYDIAPKCTAIMAINNSWLDDLERFCERKRIAGKSEGTISRYRYVLTTCLAYINKAIKDITEADLIGYIEMYKRMRNVSNCTLEGVRLCMSSFFTWQHERGFIPKNPSRGVDPIKIPKVIRKSYSDEELEKIKQDCKCLRDKAMVEFLYTTGVRISEMVALNREDVHVIDKTIIVYGKGAKEREVYMTDVSCMYLSAYLYQRTDNNPALFVSHKKPHDRLTAGAIRTLLRKIGLHTGVEKVHPHRFRRTCATNLLRKGMPIEEVSQILGHEKLDTTRLYCVVDKEKVKADHRRFMAA